MSLSPTTGKPAAPAKSAVRPLNTATVRPAQVSPAKRFVPHYIGEPIAGFTHGIRNPDGSWQKPGGRAVPGATLGQRPYYTDKFTTHYHAGPSGDPSTQWNAAQVAAAKNLQIANYGTPGYLLRSMIPGGLDEGGAKSAADAVARGVDIASWFVPPGAAVKGAGLFGLGIKGLKGLRGVKGAEAVTEAGVKAVHAAEAAAPAGRLVESPEYKAAQQAILNDPASYSYAHARPELTPEANQKLNALIREHIVAPPAAAKPPTPVQTASDAFATRAAQVREGMKGAPSRYGAEKAARKVEESARVKKASDAFYSATDPYEALAVSGKELRGPYAQIDYKGLKELTPDTVKQLMMDARDHPALGFYQSRVVMKALQAAVDDGRVPRPAEQRLIAMVFGEKTARGIAQQAIQSGFDKFLNIFNIPRALQTTLDVSGLMRQNLVAMASHPVIGARTLPVAFKSMTAKGFEEAQQAVKDNPFYASFVSHGGHITDIGEQAAMILHEEGFQSDIAANLLDNVPKIPNFIKGSARSYVATGNSMRMAVFENRMRIAKLAADPTIHDEKTLRDITRVINAATGRGELHPRLDHLLPAMNTFLYSPRLMLSRIHYLNPLWYRSLSGPARREALRGLFALSGSVTTALYLFSRIPGVSVNWNQPQNANWGKLRIGNTRIDIAGGFQPYIRLASELAPGFLGGGKTISSTTGKTTKFGSGFGAPTRLTTLEKFGLGKASPPVGFVANVLNAMHDPTGAPLTWGSLANNYLTPLTLQDAKALYADQHGGMNGIAAAIAGYGLGATGVGVQTYGPPAPKGGPVGGGDPYDVGGSGSGSGDPYDVRGSSGGGGDPYDTGK